MDEGFQRQNMASIDEVMGSVIGSLPMAVGALPYPWGEGGIQGTPAHVILIPIAYSQHAETDCFVTNAE